MIRIWFLVLGAVSLILAIVGIVLPGLPTTPFLLLAAYGFSRSSNRIHDWLITHNVFGPLITNWEERGAISQRAKILALASMVAVFALSLFLNVPLWALAMQGVILIAVAIFVATRPE